MRSNSKRHRPGEVVAKRLPSRAECHPCARYGARARDVLAGRRWARPEDESDIESTSCPK